MNAELFLYLVPSFVINDCKNKLAVLSPARMLRVWRMQKDKLRCISPVEVNFASSSRNRPLHLPFQPYMSRVSLEQGSKRRDLFWQGVVRKRENLEDENWGLEVQTGSFCFQHPLETKMCKQRGS